jgi:hypothetical protein
MLHTIILKSISLSNYFIPSYPISTSQLITAPAALRVAATEQYLSMDKAQAFSAFSLVMLPLNLKII